MSTIVTRAGKGSPLTFAEVDANFTNLNTTKIETSNLSASTGSSLVGHIASGATTSITPDTVAKRLNLLDRASRVATNADGFNGGGVSCYRNATAVTGGTYGVVNASISNQTDTGVAEISFEWGILGILNNYSEAGSNVAIYGQGNKRSTGITWAGVFEARDFTHVNNPTAGLIGIEVDTFGNGTDSSNFRVGVDISIGKDDQSGAIMETGIGVRVGATDGVITQGRVKTAFALGVIEFDIGFDTAIGTQSAFGVGIRLADGHKLAFNTTMTNTLQFFSNTLIYQVSGTNRWTCTDTGATNQTGILQINSTQVITARRTGYTLAMTGTANRATSYATSTITLEQLAERVKALQDDLSTHGLIGV